MNFFSDFIGIYKKYYSGEITYKEFYDFFLLKENFFKCYFFFLATIVVWSIVYSLRIEIVVFGLVSVNIFVLYRFLLLKGTNKLVIFLLIGLSYMALVVLFIVIVVYLDTH